MVQHVSHIGQRCQPGAGDDNGTLALPAFWSHGGVIDFVTPSGVFLRESGAWGLSANPLPQPAGFAEVTGPGYLGPRDFVGILRWDTSGKGAPYGSLVSDHFVRAADPARGVLVAGNVSLTRSAPADRVALMASGGSTVPSVKWGPSPLASNGAVLGFGVDLLGRSLVITDGTPRYGSGSISAQWCAVGSTATKRRTCAR